MRVEPGNSTKKSNSLKNPPQDVQLKKTKNAGKALDKSLKKCSNRPPENLIF
jgi:hypothetical protein